MASVIFHVNGKAQRVESWDPDQPLLYLGVRLRQVPTTPERVKEALAHA